MADHNNPQSRNEEILIATIDGKEYNKAPQSRMEELLLELKETIEEGGGGGGTTNYENLSNQPQVNGETLIGNKTGADLGLVDAVEGKDLSTNDYDDNEKAAVAAATSAISAMQDGSELNSFGDVETALAGKQGTLTAGDYVSINNNEIKVRTSKGTELHSYKFTSEGGGYYLKVEKYVKGTKVSETTYSNSQIAGQEIDIDGVMTLTYTYAGYLWSYTLLTESREHLEGQTVSWYYSDPVEFTENFDIAADASKNLVLKEDLDAAISSAYHHAGTKTCSELVAGLLVAGNEGNVYNMTDSGTTTSDFIEGAGQPIKAGDNVGIAKISDGVYKFDLLSGFVDTTNFVQKSQTAGLLKNDGTVNDEIKDDVDSLMSGLTSLDNEVNGDAVTYPYADVITINDAVPSNLADCKVKIEPVQDLHGYDKPWVGGAGKNKLPYPYVSDDGTYSTVSITTDWDGTININGTPIGDIYYTLTGNDFILPQGEYIISVDNIPDNTRIVVGPTYLDRVNKSRTITSDGTTPLNIYLNMNIHTGATNISMKPMLRLATEQDSTFAPYTNICPISGHTEASVTNHHPSIYTTNNTVGIGQQSLVDILSDNSFRVYNTENKSYVSSKQLLSNYNLVAGKTYTMEADAEITSGTAELSIRTSSNSIMASSEQITTSGHLSCTFTMASDMKYMSFFATYDSAVIGDVTYKNIKFYEGEPKTYTLALGDTIYGGTVDFKTGVLTVDRAIKDVDSLERNSGTSYYAIVSPSPKASNLDTIASDKIETAISSSDVGIYTNSLGYIRINTPIEYSTSQDMLTAYGGSIQVVYELATPFTIQLTPEQIQLLQGTNTLYASTGDISVTVNGVSGAIGAVQEQVNDHEERIGVVESGLTNVQTQISGLRSINKGTAASSGNAVFTCTSSRYVGILMVYQTTGYNAIYAIQFYNGTFIKQKLSGSDLTINEDTTTGSFTVPLGSWGTALFITPSGSIS